MAEDIRNLWYMAGWEEEIAGAGFLTRTLLGTPMVFFRKADGAGYVALADRCPHRFAPLSRGKREGDNVVCGYHGLTFDPQGKCVRSPFSDSVPPGCEAKSFPVVAKDSILWFWPGDSALADSKAISDFSCMTGSAPLGRGHLRFEANYELLTDNLMDLSHVEFLHTGSFGGGGVMFSGEHSVKHDQDAIWSNWWMANIPPPPWATFLPTDMKVDHWMDMRWQAPAGWNMCCRRRSKPAVDTAAGGATHHHARDGDEFALLLWFPQICRRREYRCRGRCFQRRGPADD
jgi:phenylpropionate dioxygenase-like ring-hydroxylating dioxygenase large terminal subunit